MSAENHEISRAKISINANNEASVETTDHELSKAITVGVNEDTMDFNKLIFWSGLGVTLVTTFVVIWIFASQMFFDQSKANATATSTYYAVEKLTEDANNHIQSYGVIDAEKGVYHIPVEQAIEKMTTNE